MRNTLLILSTFIFFGSCSSDEPELPNIDGPTLLKMARVGDPSLRIKRPKDIATALVECSEYTPNCRYGYIVYIRGLEVKTLFYNKQKDALIAAKRIKGYTLRNWVLDDVTGEPVLERFVKKYLKAEKH